MYTEVLTEKQTALLKLIKNFSKDFYLAGGTAIALQIGHRRSIDFDLFTTKPLKRGNIQNIIKNDNYEISDILVSSYEQLHILVNFVKLTFFQFEFEVNPSVNFDGIISLPTLIDLAAMKAFALGGRAKWKDYVDIYFLLRDHFSIKEIAVNANKIFGGLFSEKLFIEQLGYFEDIDYTEQVEFVNGNVTDEEIKSFLLEKALSNVIG
ncbi:MAG: nucleotidyl transferase AbiEii/AbiGii toxin family protein [Bacteroidota bacterium]|jgi:hypothetical protein